MKNAIVTVCNSKRIKQNAFNLLDFKLFKAFDYIIHHITITTVKTRPYENSSRIHQGAHLGPVKFYSFNNKPVSKIGPMVANRLLITKTKPIQSFELFKSMRFLS